MEQPHVIPERRPPGERVEPYEHRAVEAFYLDPYLVGLLASRPCESPDDLPPPGAAFA
jgi:hypothetical protein